MIHALLLGAAGQLNAAIVTVDNFDTDEGHFTWTPTQSGSKRRVLPTSTADQSALEFFEGSGSQKLVINMDSAAPAFTDAPAGPAEWFVRHVSGGGAVASNVSIPNNGNTWVGYWLKTTASNVEAGIMIDDYEAGVGNHEMSVYQPIMGDGLWHLYQFQLSNPDSWNVFVGTTPTLGSIDRPFVSIDSLCFRGMPGVAESVTFYVDSVVYSDSGPIPVPEPSAMAFAGLGALALLRRKR